MLFSRKLSDTPKTIELKNVHDVIDGLIPEIQPAMEPARLNVIVEKSNHFRTPRFLWRTAEKTVQDCISDRLEPVEISRNLNQRVALGQVSLPENRGAMAPFRFDFWRKQSDPPTPEGQGASSTNGEGREALVCTRDAELGNDLCDLLSERGYSPSVHRNPWAARVRNTSQCP